MRPSTCQSHTSAFVDTIKGRNVVAGLCSPTAAGSHQPLSMQVEGGDIARPSWLGFAVHLFNSAVAWTDILIAHPRSFTRRSERISLGLILFFTLWILLCSHFNGAFPYPFLNAMPWPQVSLLRECCRHQELHWAGTSHTHCTLTWGLALGIRGSRGVQPPISGWEQPTCVPPCLGRR